MPPDPSRLPRPGALLTEEQLGDAARQVLTTRGVTHDAAAEALGLKRAEITQALNPAKYPARGNATRRAILQLYADITVGPALFRIARGSAESGRAEDDSGG